MRTNFPFYLTGRKGAGRTADIRMDPNTDIVTATMARVYADQGYYEKAAEIYRQLLLRSPDRNDLADALAKAEAALEKSRSTDEDRLVSLFSRWFTLAAGQGRIDFFTRLSRELGDRR